jgi:hypothetical protein
MLSIPRYVTTQDVTRMLGVTETALRNWRNAGEGPPWKRKGLGGAYLYPLSELIEWADRNGVAIVEMPPEPDQPEQKAAGE